MDFPIKTNITSPVHKSAIIERTDNITTIKSKILNLYESELLVLFWDAASFTLIFLIPFSSPVVVRAAMIVCVDFFFILTEF